MTSLSTETTEEEEEYEDLMGDIDTFEMSLPLIEMNLERFKVNPKTKCEIYDYFSWIKCVEIDNETKEGGAHDRPTGGKLFLGFVRNMSLPTQEDTYVVLKGLALHYRIQDYVSYLPRLYGWVKDSKDFLVTRTAKETVTVSTYNEHRFLMTSHASKQLLDYYTFMKYGATRMPPAKLYRITLEIIHFLSQLHAMKIVHGDMNPEFISLSAHTSGNFVIISSLRFAVDMKNKDIVTYYDHASLVRYCVEERLYFSPERLNQKMTYQHDVWSFACILAQILHKDNIKPCRGALTPDQLKERIVTNKCLPYAKSDFPEEIWEKVLLPCWIYDWKQRPTSALVYEFMADKDTNTYLIDYLTYINDNHVKKQSNRAEPNKYQGKTKLPNTLVNKK